VSTRIEASGRLGVDEVVEATVVVVDGADVDGELLDVLDDELDGGTLLEVDEDDEDDEGGTLLELDVEEDELVEELDDGALDELDELGADEVVDPSVGASVAPDIVVPPNTPRTASAPTLVARSMFGLPPASRATASASFESCRTP
jgi:hypothetical protein